MTGPIRYLAHDEDSGRWAHVPRRDDDIVISTRSKNGTTWMQMICALLVFRRPDLPAPLSELSPWVDWLVEPLDDMVTALEQQDHRRFMKTHTPLDGIPIDDRVTYITVARHPLDMGVSLYHHGNNINRERLRSLTGNIEDQSASDTKPAGAAARPELGSWLQSWIDWDGPPADRLDSIPGLFHHVGLAWSRRHQPNMILVHFDDLQADLTGQMAMVADRLGIEITTEEIEDLSQAASFDQMKQQGEELAPDRHGVLKDRSSFFRGGRSGDGWRQLDPDQLRRYRHRVESLAEPELLAWLHRDRW